MQGVAQTDEAVRGADQAAAAEQREAALAEIAGSVQADDAAPGEPADQHLARLGVRLRAARPGALRDPRQQNYKQTGLLQAYAAYSLLQQPPSGPGSPPACQAFGHRELLGVLRSFGLVLEPVLTVRQTEGRVRLVDYLDKGASLGPRAPCLTTDGAAPRTPRCGSSASGSRRRWPVGVAPGDKVAILSANDPVAFTCVFGISRAGAVWCPINPRNEAAENRELLDLFDCAA